ncbi:DUF7507 domain-containing protein [Amphritea sp. HPY]|uniref:DUF7507 domain-containing protein n=1 Tax=Amphritea sp. HPY TaxID=3421652 RepID=UPI003D7DA02C
MRTFSSIFKFTSFIMASVFAAALMIMMPAVAVDGNPPGLFELEGNTLDDSGAGLPDDWATLYNGGANNGGSPVAFTGILPDFNDPEADTSVFWKGGSKDIHDVDQWWHKAGSTPPKDQIQNAYAAAYVVEAGMATPTHQAGDLIIYFGLDRLANNGDAFAGFWFFQDPAIGETAQQFTGNHVAKSALGAGDLLMLVEYPQGANAVPRIQGYEWDPNDFDGDGNLDAEGHSLGPLDLLFDSKTDTGGDPTCDGSGNKVACAITNSDSVSVLWPYADRTGPLNSIPFESFYEGGVNVTALLGETPCFSAFLAETRASHSEDAVLKDYVMGAFEVCSIAVTKQCSADVNTAGDMIEVSFDGVVTNTGALPLEVTVVDDMGTPGDTGDDVTVYGPQTLAAGASDNYNGSFLTMSIPSTDVVNATGTRGLTTVTATDTATCSPDINPDIMVDKACVADINDTGDGLDVTFSGTVTNTGNVKLTGVTVTDNNGTPGNTTDDQQVLGPIDLAPGASSGYSGSFGASGASSTDIVVATGTDVLTSTPVSDNATATCQPVIEPEIEVTKACFASLNSAGNMVNVTFNGVVSNLGNVKLNEVTVTDDNGTPGNPGDDVQVLGPIMLGLGGSANYSGGFTTASFSSTDTVTAEGVDALASTPVSDTAEATCQPDVNPDIMVSKQCTAALNASADAVVVSFNGTVTNNGDVALDGVIVMDNNGTPGIPGDDVQVFGPATLIAGASANYSGSFITNSSSSTDIVTASGADTFTSTPVSDTAQATCAADINPAIAVTKLCTDSTGAGQPILFNGVVTNTGNVTLNGITVVDDNGTPGNLADDQTVYGPASLAPGASANYNGSYIPAGTGESTDVVIASGNDAVDGTPVQASATATCFVPSNEGCTPGYWKQDQHFGNWTAPYSPVPVETKYRDAFGLGGNVLPNDHKHDTLLDALWAEGNTDHEALLRHSAAALLNAASADVGYPMSIAQIIALVQDAWINGNEAAAHAILASLNEDSDCPLARAELP